MNNYQISSLLRRHPHTRRIFKGVFSADNVPVTAIDEPTAYVVNLDDSDEPGSHWTGVYASPLDAFPEFFDSYGFVNHLPRLDRFLGDVYIHNNRELQSIFSSSCGQHVIFFILCKAHNKCMSEIIQAYPGPPLANDIFVNKIVEAAFGTDLDIINASFLHKQISRAAWR